MAITFERVIQQILLRLGAVKGATAATAETNYGSNPDVTTVIGPDFTPGPVEEALAATLGEIVEAIASTPLHPERGRFESDTDPLANNDEIPRVDSGGITVIGVPGRVRDSANGKTLLEVDADRVRSFNEFPSIYGGVDFYWYAKVGDAILHTRPNVLIRVCAHTRPTVFAGDINIDEWHEGGLVAGSVAKLALKESMFAGLYQAANAEWMAHLAKIKNYANPELYARAQSAPSST